MTLTLWLSVMTTYLSDRIRYGSDLLGKRVHHQQRQQVLPDERQGDGQCHDRNAAEFLHKVERRKKGYPEKTY